MEGSVLCGKYRIVDQLGEGGMGVVWRAVHARTGRKLAIKVLDRQFLEQAAIVERFGREARAASAIQHPGIVEVLDLDRTDDGLPFLVMELLEGETLAQRLESCTRLTQTETLDVMGQLLDALGAAHAHGVIHRDLKPENILLLPRPGGEQTVKIVDFGISRKQDERVVQLTMVGSVLGTPHYMAPEQARGEVDVDARADVYSAAVVMYECLVGDVPFDAPNYNRLLQIILVDEPTPPSSTGVPVAPAVEGVLMQALSKDREKRPQSAQEMLRLLREAVSSPTSPKQVRQTGTLPGNSSPPGMPDEVHKSSPPGSPIPELVIRPPTRRSRRRGHSSVPPTNTLRDPVIPAAPAVPSTGADPLSFEAEFSDSARGSESLELDERALRRRSSKPPRSGRAVSTAPGMGSSMPAPGAPSMRARAQLGTSLRPRISNRPLPSSGAPSVPPKGKGGARAILLYVLGGVALFAGLVLGIRWWAQDAKVPSQTPSLSAAPPASDVGARQPDPSWVRIEVNGLPYGADVRLDGLPAHLPLRVRRGATHLLEVHAPGYESRQIRFTADTSKRLSANLRPQIGVTRPN